MNLKMETNIQYVKDLPAVNVGSSFLVKLHMFYYVNNK